ncbi:hypothetical protein AMS68_003424 [Peltaster fructicola]|uniref:Uncharacterized protein n=1 Tax=Peltaster fructicola TaxID=286661 RepID=A0A6H0XT18_9PEZI|nr:hypothetical protein AMS68_003424 [Peltaster fructicola]
MASRRPEQYLPHIPLDFNCPDFIKSSPHIQAIPHISVQSGHVLEQGEFVKRIHQRVVAEGKPLRVKFANDFNDISFGPEWLSTHFGDKVGSVRDSNTTKLTATTVRSYMQQLPSLAAQCFHTRRQSPINMARERLHMDNLECPSVWWNTISRQLPVPLSQLAEDTTTNDIKVSVGYESTFAGMKTSYPRSLTADMMVDASAGDGLNSFEHQGSTVWFVVEAKDKEALNQHFDNLGNNDYDAGGRFMSLQQLQTAPVTIHVATQTSGCMILVPSQAQYQTFDCGTHTIRVQWAMATPTSDPQPVAVRPVQDALETYVLETLHDAAPHNGRSKAPHAFTGPTQQPPCLRSASPQIIQSIEDRHALSLDTHQEELVIQMADSQLDDPTYVDDSSETSEEITEDESDVPRSQDEPRVIPESLLSDGQHSSHGSSSTFNGCSDYAKDDRRLKKRKACTANLVHTSTAQKRRCVTTTMMTVGDAGLAPPISSTDIIPMDRALRDLKKVFQQAANDSQVVTLRIETSQPANKMMATEHGDPRHRQSAIVIIGHSSPPTQPLEAVQDRESPVVGIPILCGPLRADNDPSPAIPPDSDELRLQPIIERNIGRPLNELRDGANLSIAQVQEKLLSLI